MDNKLSEINDENLNEVQKSHLKTATDAVSQLYNAVTGIITSSSESTKQGDSDGKQAQHQRVDSALTPGDFLGSENQQKPKEQEEEPTEQPTTNTEDSKAVNENAQGEENDKKTQVEPLPTTDQQESSAGQESFDNRPSDPSQSNEPSQIETGGASISSPEATESQDKPTIDEQPKDQELGRNDGDVDDVKGAGLNEIQPELLEAPQEGQSSMDKARDKAAETAPDVEGQESAAFTGTESAQPQEEAGVEEPSQDQRLDQKDTSTEDIKDAGLSETRPNILKASLDGQASIEDAQTKAAEYAPTGEGNESQDQPLDSTQSALTTDPELQSEKPDNQPEASEQTLSTTGETNPAADQKDEALTETGNAEKPNDTTEGVRDAGIHETEPNLLEASTGEQTSTDEARTKAEENAPNVEEQTTTERAEESKQTIESEPSIDATKATEEPLGEQQRADQEQLHGDYQADPQQSDSTQPQALETGSAGDNLQESGLSTQDSKLPQQETEESAPQQGDYTQTQVPETVSAGDNLQQSGLPTQGSSELPQQKTEEFTPQQKDDTQAQAPEAAGAGDNLQQSELPTREPELPQQKTEESAPQGEEGAQAPSSMLDTAESKPQDSVPEPQRDLLERLEGGANPEQTSDVPKAESAGTQQVGSADQSALGDHPVEEQDSGSHEDDDATGGDGSGRKMKLTEKIKNKLKEVTK